MYVCVRDVRDVRDVCDVCDMCNVCNVCDVCVMCYVCDVCVMCAHVCSLVQCQLIIIIINRCFHSLNISSDTVGVCSYVWSS